MPDRGEVTALLAQWRQGDHDALARLIPIVYDELRGLAAHYMRHEPSGHTLQTTAVVNEAYLRLAGEKDRDWESRAHFFAVAAQIMRNLLVDHARAQRCGKRGGGCQHVILDEVPTTIMPDADELLALDEALVRLSTIDPRASRVVELRYFVGLSVEEVAAAMGVSEKTVKRDWSLAKSWLLAEMRPRT